jgi:hypothetical protein
MEKGLVFECGEDIIYQKCDYEDCKTILFYKRDAVDFYVHLDSCKHIHRCCEDHEEDMVCRKKHKKDSIK